MYRDGLGIPQDPAEAVKWYRLAADQGNASAQYNTGRAYWEGDGVPQNYVQAHMWYNLAASKSTENRELFIKTRDQTTESMIPEQIAEAQRLATEWKPKTWEVIRQELKIGPPE